MEVKLLSTSYEPDRTAAAAALGCYSQDDAHTLIREMDAKRSREILNVVMGSGHHSVVEHVVFTFSVKGVSRALTHQLVRHRLASYAQESQRYVKVTDDHSYVIPPEIADRPEARQRYFEAVEECRSCYHDLMSMGIRKEDARFILPNALKSTIIVGMNFRSWRHFLELRCDRHAQWEIRAAAMDILKTLHGHAPGIFGDIYTRFNI